MSKKNSLNSNQNESATRWIITSIIVPIVCSAIGIIIAIITLDKPVTYIYKEVSNLDTFIVTEYFPLKKGNYWTYSYKAKEQLPGSSDVKETSGTIKMIVENVRKYDNCELFEMRGDIFSQDPEEEYGYLVVANKVYHVSESYLGQLIEFLDSKKPVEYEFYSHISLEYEFPLFEGQKYGDISGMLRDDLKYVSNVNKLNTYLAKTDNRLEESAAYTIVEADIGSDMQMTFIPYVGITSIKYHHRGTVIDFEVELLKYELNEST